jgi:ribosomal-protein-alanine N-acetyltransferase
MRLRTNQLDLLPCPADVALAALKDRDELERLLGLCMPADRPAPDLQEFLPPYGQQLQRDPSLLGWGIWLIVHRAEGTVIGDVGFRGKPDPGGRVEIGYSIFPAYRKQGYASEAAPALVGWALAQSEVRKIVAQCDPENAPSIRILKRLGMQRVRIDRNLLRWEFKRPNNEIR